MLLSMQEARGRGGRELVKEIPKGRGEGVDFINPVKGFKLFPDGFLL